MDFKKSFEQASDHIKLNFLNAIIKNNQKLQTAFVNFADAGNNNQTAPDYKLFLEIVRNTTEIYHDNFELVDPDHPDWDNYTAPHDGYIPDYEAAQYAAEQEFRAIFENFESEAVNTIIEQNTEVLTAMLIGLNEARKDVEVNDEYDTFPELDDFLLEEFRATIKNIIEKLSLAALSDSTITATTALFFKYCSENYSGYSWFMSYFEDYLMTVAEKTNTPEKILSQYDQSGMERKYMPRLVLLLNKMAGNSNEWLESAKQFYSQNQAVACDLLDHYYDCNKEEFLRLATELFAKDRQYWARQLKEKISPEIDNALFVEVFYQLVKHQRSMDDYLQLRPHLSPEKLNMLLDEIDSNKSFKVQVLANEKRYEEIKAIVESNPDDWHYTELISPILEVYPEFCFNHIKYKSQKTLVNERGRSIYQRIVSWLQLADTIPGYQGENRILAGELYNHKPNLPALREELRKGGLVLGDKKQ